MWVRPSLVMNHSIITRHLSVTCRCNSYLKTTPMWKIKCSIFRWSPKQDQPSYLEATYLFKRFCFDMSAFSVVGAKLALGSIFGARSSSTPLIRGWILAIVICSLFPSTGLIREELKSVTWWMVNHNGGLAPFEHVYYAHTKEGRLATQRTVIILLIFNPIPCKDTYVSRLRF